MRPIDITVFGGTGFLGRRIVECLVHNGVGVRIAVRHPDYLPRFGAQAAENIEAVRADIRDAAEVEAALTGVRAAINAVGLYAERKGETFDAVHVDGAAVVSRAAAAAGLERLVHVSGIGADPESRDRYIRARGRGEQAARDGFERTIVLRPGVLFGPQDTFLTMLARLVRRLPVIPMFGKGQTRLQPVHVDDVAEAAAFLALVGSDASLFELGGPDILTYDELLRLVMQATGRARTLMALPMPVWRVIAQFGRVLPHPPVTGTQVTLMSHDNVVADGVAGFAELGIRPVAIADTIAEITRSEG